MPNPSWEIVALTCDNDGIPDSLDKKVELTKYMVEEAKKYGQALLGIDLNVDSRASAFKLPTTTGTYTAATAEIDFNGTVYTLNTALTPPSFTGTLAPLPNDISVVVEDGGVNWTVNIKDGTVKATENKNS